MKEKSVKFFLKLKKKGKSKFLQNHRRVGDVFAENLGLLFQS